MKSIITYLFAISLLLGPSYAQAQQLTLDECVSLALENNSRIKTAAYSFDAARETSREAFTNYFPSVSINGLAFTANHGMLQHSFGLPLSMLMPGLPNLDFDISLVKYGSFAGINLMQPIFL